MATKPNVPLYAQGTKQATQYSTNINNKNATLVSKSTAPSTAKEVVSTPPAVVDKLKLDAAKANSSKPMPAPTLDTFKKVVVPQYAQGNQQASQYSTAINAKNQALVAPNPPKPVEQLFKEAQQAVNDKVVTNANNAPTSWIGALTEPSTAQKDQMVKDVVSQALANQTPINKEAGWSIPQAAMQQTPSVVVPAVAQGTQQAIQYLTDLNKKNEALLQPNTKSYGQLVSDAQKVLGNQTATIPTSWGDTMAGYTSAQNNQTIKEEASKLLANQTPVNKEAGWSVPQIPAQQPANVVVPTYAKGTNDAIQYSNNLNQKNEALGAPPVPTEQQLKSAFSAIAPSTQNQVQIQSPVVEQPVQQLTQPVQQQQPVQSVEQPTVKPQVEQQPPVVEKPIVRATALPDNVPSLETKPVEQPVATAINTTSNKNEQQSNVPQSINLAKRATIAKRPFEYGEYVDLLDTIGDDTNLSPEEQTYLNNARQAIYADKGLLEKEMQRAQRVRDERQAQGLDVTQQQAYINTLLNKYAALQNPQQTEFGSMGGDIANTAVGAVSDTIKKETGATETPSLDTFIKANDKTDQTPTDVTQPATQPTAPAPAQQEPVDLQTAYRTLAEKSVQADIDRQNKAIDQQIAEAEQNRDYLKAEQFRAYKQAVDSANTENFLKSIGIRQDMANRGLFNSGLTQDAMVRLGISSEQNQRQLADNYGAQLGKIGLDYQNAYNKALQSRADLEAGRSKDIDALTKQYITDQQSADKYALDIKKAQADQDQALAKQAFDYINMLADKGGYDVTGLIPYAIAGNVQGLAQALKANPNLQLSSVGRELESRINENKAQADAALAGVLSDKQRAAQEWSRINGYLSDDKGNAILKNGKTQPVYTAKQDAIQNQIDRDRIAQSGANAKIAASGKGSSTSTGAGKPVTIQQQQDYVDQFVSPLLSTSIDDNGTRSTALSPANVDKFNNVMRSIYSSGVVNENILKTTYNQYGIPLPSWLAGKPFSPVPVQQSTVSEALNFMNNAQSTKNLQKINPSWIK